MIYMRGTFFSFFLSCALTSGAQAAPPVDWTGGYLGALAGYGWSQNAAGTSSFWTDTAGTSLAGTLPGFSFNGSGAFGGAETGMGWQSGGLYWGLEADVAAANITGSYVAPPGGGNFTIDSTIQWLSTVRARVGVPLDRALLFASGGLAFGGVQGTLHDRYNGGTTTLTTSDTQTGLGWTIGGGIAAALHNGWSIKAEYLYVDLGSQNFAFPEDPSGSPGWPLITNSSKTTASILRFGLDYRY